MIRLMTLAVLLVAPFALAAEPDDTFFPITPWEVPWNKGTLLDDTVNGIGSMRECGYTVASFPLASHLGDVEKAKLKAIVALPGGPIKWQKFSDQQIADKVKALVGDTANNPAVLGYFLKDEPGAME